MRSKKFSRRDFLRMSALTAAGAALAGCCPPSQPSESVAETVVVTGEAGEDVVITQVVEVTAPPPPEQVTIEYWGQPYADDIAGSTELLEGFADQFREETGIAVNVQLNNWDHARQLWLMVVQGGLHPDIGDWYFLWSNVQLGQGQYGPLPITEYKDELWPDLEERFYAGALRDTSFLGEFYGIPHRNGIRPMMYRSDYLEEAGFDRPPDTWEELSTYAQALTQRDAAGNTTRWGMEFGADSNKPQQLITFYWQAGGEVTTEDGTQATLDTPEMREALDWMSEQIWVNEVVPPDFMESAHNPMDMFTGQQVAILPQCVQARIFGVEKDFPEIEFSTAICAKGPVSRATYAGGGYWCVLRGTEHPYEAAQFMQFLSRDENMKQWSEFSGNISPNRSAMASDFWTDEPWKKALADSLEYAHSSQHATGAWSKLIAPEPGAVLYDLFYEALINKEPVDDVLARAQQRAQEEIDKTAGV